MSIEEYLDELKGQIRDRSAKEFVSDEIRDHIEEQADAYISEGMSREEALSEAVKDMGDPVSVGADLDKIHRPRMEWRFLLFVLFISVMSVGMHYLINRGLDPQNTGLAAIPRTHVLSSIIGIFVMLFVYRADYTFLLKRSRVIGGTYLSLITLLSVFFGYHVNGASRWIRIGSMTFFVHAMLLLYLPIFGGILYECRGRGKKVILQIIFWTLAPLFSRFVIGDRTLSFGTFMIVSEAMLVCLAVKKKWYQVSRRSLLMSGGIGFAAIVVMLIIFVLNLSDYQSRRIESSLSHLGIGNYVQDENGMDYVNTKLGQVFANSNLIGKSNAAANIMRNLPGYKDDLIIGSISAYCGKLVAVGICISLCLLAVYVFRISLRQKNSLGYIVGCACGVTIALQCVSNILIVSGILPMASTTLPMISQGASVCVVDYMLLGLILSIYRYKDIRTDRSTAVRIGKAEDKKLAM